MRIEILATSPTYGGGGTLDRVGDFLLDTLPDVGDGIELIEVDLLLHTIWEHPDPEFRVDEFPMWRRSVVEAGSMTFKDPDRSRAEWFDLGEPWLVGEAFPRTADA